MVKNIRVAYGKRKIDGTLNKRDTTPIEVVPSKMISIFFKYLPYWQDLKVCHSIDGMHIAKNVFESIIGILMDMKHKTKDGLKSRQDLKHLNSRPEVHPIDKGNGKYYLPAASYNLTTDEKRAFCNSI